MRRLRPRRTWRKFHRRHGQRPLWSTSLLSRRRRVRPRSKRLRCPDAAASDRGPNDCSRGGCRGKEQLVKKEAVVEAASAWLLAGRLAEIKT
jgi:hypothetical protein